MELVAAERLAWVAQRIPQIEGTGIVYCLTVDQTEQVAEFLRGQGVNMMRAGAFKPRRNDLQYRTAHQNLNFRQKGPRFRARRTRA